MAVYRAELRSSAHVLANITAPIRVHEGGIGGRGSRDGSRYRDIDHGGERDDKGWNFPCWSYSEAKYSQALRVDGSSRSLRHRDSRTLDSFLRIQGGMAAAYISYVLAVDLADLKPGISI